MIGTRQIEKPRVVQLLKDGRILIREGASTEVIRPPKGSIRWYATDDRRKATITFGSVTRGQLVITGDYGDLQLVFAGLCGVNP